MPQKLEFLITILHSAPQSRQPYLVFHLIYGTACKTSNIEKSLGVPMILCELYTQKYQYLPTNKMLAVSSVFV